jgi:hypothetical protein
MTEDQYTIRSRGQKIHIGTPGLTIIISVNARIFLGENVNKQASNRSRPRLLEDCEALDRWYESGGDGPGSARYLPGLIFPGQFNGRTRHPVADV